MLLDLSQMTNVPSSEHIGAVPIELARVASRVRFRYCAIIASKEALFGMDQKHPPANSAVCVFGSE